MTILAATNIQFVMRRPSVCSDRQTALVYGMLTASADLPDQSMIPITLVESEIMVHAPSPKALRERLVAIDQCWSYTLQELHKAPVFGVLNAGLTGGEIVVYETEIPTDAGSKMFAFFGMFRGDLALLESLAERRYSIALQGQSESYSGSLTEKKGLTYTFEVGGLPSQVLTTPIWDSNVGLVCLHTLETLPEWAVRTGLRREFLNGVPPDLALGSQFRGEHYAAYIREMDRRFGEVLDNSWLTVDQHFHFKSASRTAIRITTPKDEI